MEGIVEAEAAHETVVHTLPNSNIDQLLNLTPCGHSLQLLLWSVTLGYLLSRFNCIKQVVESNTQFGGDSSALH